MNKNIKAIIISASLATLFIHLYSNLFANYGIFRDEYYYLACTNHLAAGYVDQPPFSIYILALWKMIFGKSLLSIRFISAISASVTVYFTGLLTARIGGKAAAVFIACTTLAVAPIFLGMNTIFSMNTFDYLFWILSAYLLVRIVQENKPGLWIILGFVLGLGLLNKISMAWFGVGLFAGLLFTPLRIHLKTKWPYIAALIALVIFSPFIYWNVTHNFAHLEFIRNAVAYKYNNLTPIDFISAQLLLPGPPSILVWLPGLIYLLIGKELKPYRILGIIFLTTFLILVVNWHSKAEYLAVAYPIVFAGGGLFIEKISKRRKFSWLKYAVPGFIIVSGIISIPLALPVLPVNTYISYSAAIGLAPENSEHKELSELPQFYADMFGWEDLARTVSFIYKTIPDSEKAATIIYANNYGEAGAIDYYSSKYKLPPVVCPHNAYWYWTKPGEQIIKTIIVIGGSTDDLHKVFEEVIPADVHKAKYSMPYENNLPVFICKGIKQSLKDIWQRNKIFI